MVKKRIKKVEQNVPPTG